MNEKQQDFAKKARKPGKRCAVMFITKQMQTELALTSFQLMKVCGDRELHLCELKENQIIRHQVRVTFAATISQLTATKDSVQK